MTYIPFSGTVQIGGSNVSAFGDLITAEVTPLIQYDFVYQGTFNPQLCFNTVAGTGVADVSQGRLRLQTGVAAAGGATHQSTKIARYRAGQGNTSRFTFAFAAGAAGSLQLAGMANVGAGTSALDGYFFGFDGASYGILHRNQYGASVDTWYPRAAWNGDRCDGSDGLHNQSGADIDPSRGNVYMIRYPYLGYGDILFYVQNPETGAWILCHTIQYANTTQTIQLGNPGLNFYAEVTNLGNTTNLVAYAGSVSVTLSGQRLFTGPQWGASGRLTTNSSNVEKPVLSLRCARFLNGVANRGMIRLRSLGLGTTQGSSDTVFNVRRNVAGLNPAPSFVPVNGTTADNGVTLTAAQSMVSMDRTATSFTAPAANASNITFNTATASSGGYQIDLSPYDLFMIPGDIWTFTMLSGTNNNTTNIALNWNEDL